MRGAESRKKLLKHSGRFPWSVRTRVKNGPTLRTLKAFILSEPKAVQERKIWQCASKLLLAAAERDRDIGAVTEKVELALFLDGKLLPVATASLPVSVINAERARKLLAAAPMQGRLS
jgi:hypothetical protein